MEFLRHADNVGQPAAGLGLATARHPPRLLLACDVGELLACDVNTPLSPSS
jgi:hypothetical protein